MRLLVLVVGAGGQLGEAMVAGLSTRHEVIARVRADLDVANPTAVRQQIAAIAPDAIVNCAAYTNVDGAEEEPAAALAVNAWAPRAMARAAAEIDATLVHFSTDFVFDGQATRPYTEDDVPNPRGAYAMSKLLGEWLAAGAPRHYILRVESLFGGRRAKSSIDLLAEGIRGGRPVRAFADRTVSPSFVDDVVLATMTLLDRQPSSGVYHCVNSGQATWVEVARELARLADRPDATIEAVRMADAKLRAPRPLYAALSNDKLRAIGVALPSWQDALSRYARIRQSAPAY